MYGWYEWKKVNPTEDGGVRQIPLVRYSFYLPAIVISSIILGQYVDNNTDDPKPYLDVIATVLSVAGQWFLIRKYIENWWVWILADSVYCYLFLVQENYPSLILFSTYLVFAVIGYIQWKRLQKKSLSA
jgi:nicotinamide mononucleotide transporter